MAIISKPSVGASGWNTSVDAVIDAVNDIPAAIAAAVASSSSSSSSSTQVAYSRGVNMSGGEFAADAAHLPGVYGTDYAFDTAAAFLAIAGRGHEVIRLPFRWERIQPVRNAPLNATELARLRGVVADIRAAGMTAILDVHNYARYIVSGGAEQVLGDGNLTQDHLVDLWARLSVAFRGNPGIYAYGLMNEPHDLLPIPGSFTGTTRYDWSSGVQGWTGDAATATNVSGKLRLSATLGSGSVNTRKDDAGTVSGGSTPTGSVIRFEATLVTNPGGTWVAKAQWQNGSFTWQNPTSTTIARIDTGVTVTSLPVGVPCYVTSTFSSISSPPNALCVQIDGTGATAGSVVVDIDNYAQGTVVGGSTGAQVWETASQACVTAIRANSDTTKILVSGYGFSGAQNWATNHPAPWIADTTGGFAYEAHYYFDTGNSGVYSASYSTENAAAVTAGYASLAARAVAELGVYTSWLDSHQVEGFLGETGWPNNADTASWNAVGEAVYDLLDVHAVGATYWAAGARWGTGYILSAYTGTAQDVVKAPASIVEAHPTFRFTLAGLDARYAPIGGGGGGSGGTGPQGSPGVVWRGVYSGATTYATNDAVSYNGSAFIATAGVTGTAPGTSGAPVSPWQVLAAQGSTGGAGTGGGPNGSPDPTWNGYLGWTYDPMAIAATQLVTGGVLFLSKVWLRAGTVVTNLIVEVGTAATGATSGQCFLGLFDSTGARQGVTADQSTAWGSTGVKIAALTTPYTVGADGFFWIGTLGNAATTLPAFQRAASSGHFNNGLAAGASRSGTIGTAQTAMPSSITTGSIAASNNCLWAAVS
jgi:hypothetical protein